MHNRCKSDNIVGIIVSLIRKGVENIIAGCGRWLLVWCGLLWCSRLSAQYSVRDSVAVFQHIDSVFEAEGENNPALGIAISVRQQKIAELLHSDTLLIKAGYNHAHCLGILGLLDNELDEFYSVLRIAERNKLHRHQGRILYMIGMVYQTLLDYKKSNDYLIRARGSFKEAGSYYDTVAVNYELGFNCVATDEHRAGIAIIERNLEAAKLRKDDENIVLGLDNLSNIYFELKENEKSVAYLREILKYPGGFNSNYRRTAVNEHLAELYVELKQWDSARKYLAETYKYATAINSADWLFEYYKLQSKVDEATGNIKGALEAHKLYLNYKDSVYQKGYENKIAAMTTVYDLEKKQAQIWLLEKDKLLSAAKIRQKTWQRNAVIVGGILLVGLVAAAFAARMQRRTKDMQVAFSRSLLQSQEAERQRISRELHDSVGQNILFIKNQLSGHATEKALQPVMDTIAATMDEVRNISKELYPNQLEKYGLASAVDTLAEKVQEATGIFVSADLAEVEHKMGRDAKINCFRIIQEAMNNAMKHANAKALRITGTLADDKIVLAIQDNGKGFDKAILEKKSLGSYGVLNMEERAKMLGGKFEIESSSQGTKIIVTIPVSDAI